MHKAVLFDLFGTLVHFTAEVPTLELREPRWQRAMSWLEPLVRERLPEYAFEEFLRCLMAVTSHIVASRPPEYREVSSVERFRSALACLGVHQGRCDVLAAMLAKEHMRNLTARTQVDVSAVPTLCQLRRQGFRLGLVSNFDDEQAAQKVLERHGLLPHLDVVLISAAFGRRKPHPSIFSAALAQLEASPEQSWFVGDNYEEDILGAFNVGLRSIWVRKQNIVAWASACEDGQVTAAEVHSLAEVPACLAAA